MIRVRYDECSLHDHCRCCRPLTSRALTRRDDHLVSHPQPTSLKDVGPAIREAAPVMAPAFEAPLLLPTFSRRREIFAGRLAIVGFASVAAWEVRMRVS
jgi:hypothetical protein